VNMVQLTLIIMITLLLGGLGVFFVLSTERERKRKMLQKIKGAGGSERKIVSEKNQQDKRRAEISQKLKNNKNEEKKADKKKVTLSQQIAQAGLSISVKQFWIFSVLLMIAATALAKIMGQPPLVLGMVAVIGLLGIPRLVLKKCAAKRQKKFLEEFPDALEATVRLLKAGMPISEAILMIAREFTGPVGEEMSRIYDQQKIGVPLHEAALLSTRRMPLTEMQMFATGLAIQAQTGSSLSEVLMNLSGVIRSRFRLKRKIKALSSEAIASASIIGALPCLVAGGMYFANHDYIMVLFTDPFGRVLLIGAVTWMGIGIMMMKAMINFKI